MLKLNEQSESDSTTEIDDETQHNHRERWNLDKSVRLSDPTWQERFTPLTKLVCDFQHSDDASRFCNRQLALAIFDVNRMEGTISSEMEEGATIGKISAYLSPTCIVPEVVEWNSEDGREQSTKSTDRQLYQCARAASYLLVQNVHTPLSLELILKTYEIMMENSYVEDNHHHTRLITHRVRCGNEEVNAGWHQFVRAEYVERCVQSIARDYNSHRTSVHPITAASFLFYEMISVHPLLNGNGRLCRLLMESTQGWIFFPSEFFSKRRSHYIHAIETARKQAFW